jgi:hypothetical protein
VNLYLVSSSVRVAGSLLRFAAWLRVRAPSVPSSFGHFFWPSGRGTRKVRRSPLCVGPASGVGDCAAGDGDVEAGGVAVWLPCALGLPFEVRYAAAMPPPTTSTSSRATTVTIAIVGPRRGGVAGAYVGYPW